MVSRFKLKFYFYDFSHNCIMHGHTQTHKKLFFNYAQICLTKDIKHSCHAKRNCTRTQTEKLHLKIQTELFKLRIKCPYPFPETRVTVLGGKTMLTF